MTITLTDHTADAVLHALEARAKALTAAHDVGTLTQAEFVAAHDALWFVYMAVSGQIDEARAKQKSHERLRQILDAKENHA